MSNILTCHIALLLITSLPDWAACEEHHQDEGRHWHAFIRFKHVIRDRNARLFDVYGVHPNIKSSKGFRKDLEAIWKYLNKEGCNVWGPWKGPVNVGYVTILYLSLHYTYIKYCSAFESSKQGWACAVQASTREEFFETAKVADPKAYVTCYEKLEYYADKKFKKQVPEFQPKFTEFVRVPQEMRDWVDNEFNKVSLHIISLDNYLNSTG